MREKGVPVGAIIDVGAQRGTESLIKNYPDVPHLLIEPVNAFVAGIERNYSRIRHEIVAVALSDENGVGRLRTANLAGDEISHAWLAKEGSEVEIARLDSILPRSGFPTPYLLKIDVDGGDAPARIIEGAEGIMDEVSCVVCELVADRFVRLAARIEQFGFSLWDIVECCYYDDVFYQCDAIFVRREYIAANPSLKPFSMASFDPRKWWGSHE